jgi:PAS domain S-box-containing protein
MKQFEHSIAGAKLLASQPNDPFHGFLEAAPDAVIIVDGEGTIVQVNVQAERLFGYGREEVVGSPLELLLPKRFRDSHVAQRRAYSANPSTRHMGRGLKLFGLRKDGTEFPVDVSLSPLLTDTGTLIASAIRDMTEHRRLEDELHQRTRELEEADRQKDHFLSAVAHELRSPLSVLTQAAQLLRSPKADTATLEWVSGALQRQTAHMARLVEDLLDLCRVRCGKLALQREPVDLRTIVPQAVEMNHPLITSRKHQLEVTQSPEPLWVNGDPARLTQVLSNLLTNAAKYTPEGGHIHLTTTREDGAAVIRVRDDGKGIPKEMLSHVFNLFAQTESSNDARAEGLGIGLALVQQLVELHAGSVAAFSDGPGKGSDFVVCLPVMPNRPDAAESGNHAPLGTPSPHHLSGPH